MQVDRSWSAGHARERYGDAGWNNENILIASHRNGRGGSSAIVNDSDTSLRHDQVSTKLTSWEVVCVKVDVVGAAACQHLFIKRKEFDIVATALISIDHETRDGGIGAGRASTHTGGRAL